VLISIATPSESRFSVADDDEDEDVAAVGVVKGADEDTLPESNWQ
jgi:hypothetical protein